MKANKRKWDVPEISGALPYPSAPAPGDDGMLKFHLSALSKLKAEDAESGSFVPKRDFQELSALLWHLEEASRGLREVLLSMESPFPDGRKPLPYGKMPEGYAPQVHAEVSNDALTIHAPGTLLRNSAESWHLALSISAEIRRYETDNGVRLSEMFKSPVYIIVKRKSISSSGGYRDNENMEVTKIINALCSALGFSDSPANVVSYTSCFETVSDEKNCGTDFIVFSRDKFSDSKNFFEV